MKRLILISVLAIFSAQAFSQNLLVANNNPGAATGVNVFVGATALQDALLASVDGDIIYVVPSIVAYGNVSITTGVTIFGIGIRPDKNLGAKSIINQMNIDASNVRISGLVFAVSGFINIGAGTDNKTLSNLVIENCNIRRIIHTYDVTAPVNNVLVRNNLIIDKSFSLQFYTSSNVTVSNNVIYTSTSSSWSTVKANTVNFYNNLFISDGNGYTFNEVVNCVFDHNIFFGTRVAVGSNSTGNVWDDNLSFGGVTTTFTVGGQYANTSNSPNIENQDPLLVNMPMTAIWSDAYDFTLQTTPTSSPAININGTDIGPSGGANPFDSEGNLLPLIQKVSLPAIIPVGTDLPVTIKAKGN